MADMGSGKKSGWGVGVNVGFTLKKCLFFLEKKKGEGRAQLCFIKIFHIVLLAIGV